MKNSNLLLFLSFLFFLGCNNNSSSSNNTKDKTTSPNTTVAIGYWKKNNCTLGIPKPTIPTKKQPVSYSYEMNKQKGYAKEIMILENNYTLEITSKGCNTRWITYSFSFPVEDLDIKNTTSVSQKIIELIKMTSQSSQSSIDLESKIKPLEMAVDQIGPFSIGEEFILKDGQIKEAFVLEQLKEKNGKILLDYYFTKETH